MSERAKGFDQGLPAWIVGREERMRRNFDAAFSEASMINAAMPPQAMQAAPIAPARGTMRLVDNWTILPGGTRRSDGAHWVNASALDVENHFARQRGAAAALDRAEDRAERAGRAATEDEREAAVRRVELFTPAQVAMADRYRALVEWRAGSAVKCAKLDGGAGGAGRDYMDSFIAAGDELARLQAVIGDAVILSPRRHMDRDNARGPVGIRAAFDAVVIKGWTISRVLQHHGWAPDMKTRRVVRDAIRGVLDRMQGYADGGPQNVA